MNIRNGGMSDEGCWESVYDVWVILTQLGIETLRRVAEVSCGYGTFSVPIARVMRGRLCTSMILARVAAQDSQPERWAANGAGVPNCLTANRLPGKIDGGMCVIAQDVRQNRPTKVTFAAICTESNARKSRRRKCLSLDVVFTNFV